MKPTSPGLPLTVSIPVYGDIAYGLSRNSSYAAARFGVFPTVDARGKRRVPVRLALRQLAGGDEAVLETVTRDFAIKLQEKTT
jgi:hypothetical protein